MRFQPCLQDNERKFISHVLAFFAASDGIVNENLVSLVSFSVLGLISGTEFHLCFLILVGRTHALCSKY